MAFFVYENWTRKRGRAHIGSCRHCNFGEGKNDVDYGQNGKWHQFDTKEDADKKVTELVAKGWDLKWCATCT
jgi:hypothetical protein